MTEPNPARTDVESSVSPRSPGNPAAADIGAAGKHPWKRPSRWVALGVLYVIALAIGFGAGRQARARSEFDRGLTDGKNRGWYDRDLHAYHAEMSLVGLNSDRYPEGSGCYIARYDLSTRVDTSITGKIVVRKLPRFSPSIQMVHGRYYQVRRDGTVRYRNR
jgi:hypothetical protein